MRRKSPGDEVREDAWRRLAARAKQSREARVRNVYAQAGEPVWKTLSRVLYLSACVVFDGVVLLEVVRIVPGWAGWALYALMLAVAVRLQIEGYRRWFRASPTEG